MLSNVHVIVHNILGYLKDNNTAEHSVVSDIFYTQ